MLYSHSAKEGAFPVWPTVYIYSISQVHLAPLHFLWSSDFNCVRDAGAKTAEASFTLSALSSAGELQG